MWEPATLQQRNGRGVRQGNTLSAIAIYYYFSGRSQDGLRFNLIQGKRGWMTQLLIGVGAGLRSLSIQFGPPLSPNRSLSSSFHVAVGLRGRE